RNVPSGIGHRPGPWTVRHRVVRLLARTRRRPEFVDLRDRAPPRTAWSLFPIHEQQVVAPRGSLRPTYSADLLAATALGKSLRPADEVWNRVLGVSNIRESVGGTSRT